MKEETKGALLMALSAVFFSLGGLLIKLIPWGPVATNGVRCVFATAVFGVYMIAIGKKPVINIPTFLGALGLLGTTAFFNAATKFTTAGNAIILEYTSPVFIILFSYLLFRKKPQKADLCVAAAVLFGMVWFFLDSLSSGHFLGNIFGICAALSVSVVYVIKLHPKADMASLIFFGLLLAAVTGTPFIVNETVFTPEVWLYVAILGLIQMGLAYIIFFLGITRCSPVSAVVAGSLEPILNPIWVAIFYGEMIRPLAFPGVVIVLMSVIVYNIYTAKGE